ncbi:NADPH-dependent F420 reductase [Rhizobium leguminosarum]|uniref:NADPH-dependent F420 reductase n=1 Tax=Rhizobium leguminosarum TaxID=384 RepID=UPI003F974170
MKIGIFGTGNIGGTLARKLAAAGHDVRITNSKPSEKLNAFAADIGATPVDAQGVVDGADMIILSIPFPAVAALPQDLFANLAANVPVVDTGNYYPGMRDPHIAEIDDGLLESVWVSNQIGRRVIKAFNNILAATLADGGRPVGAPDRIAAAVAGDDEAQKRIVMGIVDEVGFDPIDSGSLDDSWRQQPSTPVYCCDWNVEETRKALAQAVKGKAAATRDKLPEQFAALGPNPKHADVIASNRENYAPA